VSDMRRRHFLALIAGGSAAWPLVARAQQGMRRIGVLMGASENEPEFQTFLAAFREELGKFGWAGGRNLQIDYRWAGLDAEATKLFAKELVLLQPDLIFSSSTFTTAALLQQTRTIPIIFANIVDPIGSGFVASLARPAGNATGFVNLEPTMVGKWLELLKEIAPHVMRVTAVYHPDTAPYVEVYLTPFKATAPSLAIETIVAPAHDMSEFDSICAAQARQPNGGLFVVPDPYFLTHRAEVALLVAGYRLPAVYFNRAFAEAGGLLSYGNDIADNYRRAASYVDRILKGAQPSELPVQAPVKFELVINLKTAKALGLDVPWILQQRADAVIE